MRICVLLMLAVLFSVAEAQETGRRCYIGGFTGGFDTRATKVRSGPGEGYRVIAALPVSTLVRVDRCDGPWLRIYSGNTVAGQWIFGGKGWVHASRLATRTRYAVDLHAHPDQTSDVRKRVPADAVVQLVGAKDKWAKVQYQTVTGWLEPEAQCPNPVTTCP